MCVIRFSELGSFPELNSSQGARKHCAGALGATWAFHSLALCAQSPVLCAQSPVLCAQSSVLCAQSPVLCVQSPANSRALKKTAHRSCSRKLSRHHRALFHITLLFSTSSM